MIPRDDHPRRIQELPLLARRYGRVGPLTILVGPNACGKSTILRGIDLRRNTLPDDAWMKRNDVDIRRSVTLDSGSEDVLDLPAGSAGGGATTQGPVVQALALDPNAARVAEPPSAGRTILTARGEGIVNVFAALPRKERDKVAVTFREIVPAIGDIDTRPADGGRLEFYFQDRWNPAVRFRPSEVSDGTILALAFLLLEFQSPPPDVLTIEEPERGLHPYLMGRVLGLLRKLAEGTLTGRPTQVIAATHSADFLEHARPDEVRFVSRTRDGNVVVQRAPTDTPDWTDAYREYDESLGDMWLAGGLGGVPGAGG